MIKVFTGPMYAAKSYELIKTGILRKRLGENNVICFKPSKDTRDLSEIKSRDLTETLEAFVIQDLSQIKEYITDEVDTIIIDEAQFLTGSHLELIWLTIEYEVDIYIAGLDLTSELAPFGSMPGILSVADEIVKLKARCNDCGMEAKYSYCLIEKEGDILVGDQEYIPLCDKCLGKRYQLKPRHKHR